MNFLARNIVRAALHNKNNVLGVTGCPCSRTMSSLPDYKYEVLKVTSPKEFVYNVELNRPEKLNAMNKVFWKEVPECFNQIASDPDCRVVVLTAAGRVFTAGLDLTDAAEVIGGEMEGDPGRMAFKLRQIIPKYQASFSSIEQCNKPVIAAIHSACVGGGIDLITACDIRYCTNDAWFTIKEVDIGLAADVGTLQRLPKIVGNESLVRELAFTGRKMFSSEAKELGLVGRVFVDKDALTQGAMEIAEQIASKSPVAVQGTKANLIYSRDHSVPDSLEYIVTWNSAMLQSEDVMKAAMASMQKQTANFSKL